MEAAEVDREGLLEELPEERGRVGREEDACGGKAVEAMFKDMMKVGGRGSLGLKRARTSSCGCGLMCFLKD